MIFGRKALFQNLDEIHPVVAEKYQLFATAHGPVHDGGSDVEKDVTESLQRFLALSYHCGRTNVVQPKLVAWQLRKSGSVGHRLWLVLAQEFLGFQRPHGQTLQVQCHPKAAHRYKTGPLHTYGSESHRAMERNQAVWT